MDFHTVFLVVFGLVCFGIAFVLFVRRWDEFAWIGVVFYGCVGINALAFRMDFGIATGGGILAFLVLAGAYLLFRKEQWTRSTTIGAIMFLGAGSGWVNLYVWANNIPMCC